MVTTPALVRLPLRCDPIAGESLSGFIHRLAERNLVRPAASLLRGGHRRPFPVYDDMAALEHLAVLSDRSVAALATMGTTASALRSGPEPHPYAPWAQVFLGQVVDNVQLRDWRRAFCPACLNEAAFHRASWELHFLTACPVHRCALATICPRCEKAVDWNTSTLTGCRCGQDLRVAPVEEWDPVQLRATDYIAARLAGTVPEGEPACLRGLPLLHAVEMLRFFGAWAGGTSPDHVSYTPREARLADYLNEGLTMLSMGPERQLVCLDQLSRDLDSASTKRGQLARWCDWIEEVGNAETTATLNLVRYAGGILIGAGIDGSVPPSSG